MLSKKEENVFNNKIFREMNLQFIRGFNLPNTFSFALRYIYNESL